MVHSIQVAHFAFHYTPMINRGLSLLFVVVVVMVVVMRVLMVTMAMSFSRLNSIFPFLAM